MKRFIEISKYVRSQNCFGLHDKAVLKDIVIAVIVNHLKEKDE